MLTNHKLTGFLAAAVPTSMDSPPMVVGEAPDAADRTLSPGWPRRALTIKEAQELAFSYVRSFEKGFRFTSQGLFGGLRLRGRDNRSRSQIIRSLQMEGVIGVVGVTKQDQEGRNGGFAVLWEVL